MPSHLSLARVHRTLSAVLAVAILVMAAIAGNALFGTWDIEIHGWIGNGVFTGTLVGLGLALARKASADELVLAGALAVLAFAQIGLGYVGRDTADAAAWHIPNGVLLMALSAYQVALLQQRVSART